MQCVWNRMPSFPAGCDIWNTFSGLGHHECGEKQNLAPKNNSHHWASDAAHHRVLYTGWVQFALLQQCKTWQLLV